MKGVKKVWQVDLSVIEQGYHGRCSTLLGIARGYAEAGLLAIDKENQGSEHQSVKITSIKYLGELSFWKPITLPERDNADIS